MGQSRNENILENMLGASNPIAEPQSRIEELLIDIYNQGAGLPDVDQSDDGKVLAVVNGEWDKADIPDGNLPVVSDADNGKVLGVKNGAWAVDDISEEYAKPDGYYEEMSVGNADQLISTVMVEDKEPYAKRTSGGSADIGNRLYEKIVGGSIAWNQLFDYLKIATTSDYGVTITNNNNGSYTISGTISGGPLFSTNFNIPSTAGHIYFASGKYIQVREGSNQSNIYGDVTSDGKIFTLTTAPLNVRFRVWESVSPAITEWPQIFDLTQMFGSEIADHILALETATAGAGVALFRKLFPTVYYAYNAGTLMSVKAAAHKMVGFNQFNKDDYDAEEDHYPIYLIAGNQYEISPISLYQGSQTINIYEDADWQSELSITINTTTQRGTFTPTKSGIHYVNIGAHGCSPDELCIHLVWSGYRNGEFEEYKERTYPLDTSLELRGIPKLDANNKLIYDGDIYESDGTVTRKYGIVDLGSLTWTKNTSYAHPMFYANLSDAKEVWGSGGKSNAVCARYVNTNNGAVHNTDKSFVVQSSYLVTATSVWINDSAYENSTESDFQTAMRGVYLVYELATPTTESAEPWQSPQVVDDFGTEEYIDYGVQQGTREVAIPVGHESEYPANLRDKLQRLPNLPDANGDYIVRYADRQASFVAYDGDGRLNALEEKIPSAPTTDGTYRLTVTVADGEPTYSWESVS